MTSFINMSHCCVPQCVNDSRYSHGLSFHTFPKDIFLRKIWIKNIRRDPGINFKITRCTFVCSAHFKAENFKKTLTGIKLLKPGVAPTIFTWTDGTLQKRKPRRNTECPATSMQHIESGEGEESRCYQATVDKLPDHDYLDVRPPVEDQLKAAQERIKQLEKQLDEQRRPERHFLERYSQDPAKIQFYTGFPTYALLMAFFNFVVPHASMMTHWSQVVRLKGGESSSVRAGSQSELPLIDQFFLFLNKVKLGSFDEDLGDKFGTSSSTVSKLIISWANFLYVLLGRIPLWPTREMVDQHMPDVFKQFPKTRVILDCTKVFVQAPSSLSLNSELYPHCKGHDTFKCLVGISPGGLVTFVSNLYAGGISNKEITKQSGILDLLEPGDEIMVDKGFEIEDLLRPIGCSLVIPPFLAAQSGKFSKEETKQMQTIARLRVHVERAIRRVKQFHLFNSLIPTSLGGTVNQMWTVCCILTNFQGPLS